MNIVTHTINFSERHKPFKGFISTWETDGGYNHTSAVNMIAEFKKIPILMNIQYMKRKYSHYNKITVSFKTEEDNAAFMLLSSGGISITYDYCDF